MTIKANSFRKPTEAKEKKGDEEDLSGNKRCWMVDQGLVISKDTRIMILALKERIEEELHSLNNGKLREMEFEFPNRIEFAYHFRSEDTEVDVVCISLI